MKKLVAIALILCLVGSLCATAAAEDKYATWGAYVLRVLSANDLAALSEADDGYANRLNGLKDDLARPVIVRFGCAGGTNEAKSDIALDDIYAIVPDEFILKDGDGNKYEAAYLQFYGIDFDQANATFTPHDEQPRFALVFDVPETVAVDDLRLSIATEKEGERILVRLGEVLRLDGEHLDDLNILCTSPVKEK